MERGHAACAVIRRPIAFANRGLRMSVVASGAQLAKNERQLRRLDERCLAEGVEHLAVRDCQVLNVAY